MKTPQSISSLMGIREEIEKQNSNTEVINVSMSDFEFDEGNGEIIVQDNRLDEGSKKSFFKILGIDPKFKERASQKDPELWNNVKSKVTKIYDDYTLALEVNKEEKEVTSLNQSAVASDKFDYSEIIKTLEFGLRTLESGKVNVDLPEYRLNLKKGMVELNFTSVDSRDLMIENYNGSDDEWEFGTSVIIQPTSVELSNYYFRLICTNGMKERRKKLNATVSNGKLDKIQEKFVRLLTDLSKPEKAKDPEQTVAAIARRNVQMMTDCNLSLAEYQRIIQPLEKRSEENDNIYANIMNNVFVPWHKLAAAYSQHNIDVNKQSKKWLATANSGLNTYEIFNNLTDVSTHHAKYKEIFEEDRQHMQQCADELFGKDSQKYDMMNLAPQIEFTV